MATVHSGAVQGRTWRSITRPVVRFPIRRFVVADRSMEPTLSANEGLIALLWPRARPGQLRVFEHPQRPNFWLVKRVASVDGGEMVVASDNRTAPTVDSRSFGPVPTAGSYRVVWNSGRPVSPVGPVS